MAWLITHSVAALLLPPGCLLLIAAAGGLLARRRPRLGRALVIVSLAGLYGLSTPYAADALLRALEPAAARDPLAGGRGEAIVVLGGGTYFAAPEYGGDTVSEWSLVRLRYAARLHRASGLPVLVTGGAPLGNATPEADQMKAVLEREFRVPVRWAERGSDNTLENARLSRRLLEAAGISRIHLVTHAWHVPRARLAFERAGFEVLPAPTDFATRHRLSVLDFLPSAAALHRSARFFHEAIGIGWYHLRFLAGR